MKTSLAELGIGVVTAMLSVFLVAGALLMSIAEGRPAAAIPPEVTATPANPADGSQQPSLESSPTIAATLTCPVPIGWESHTLEPGDSWESLAARTGASVDELQRGNCQFTSSLLAGTLFNLPKSTPTPSPTTPPTSTTTVTPAPAVEQAPDTPVVPSATAIPKGCSYPKNWRIYIVQPGENLYQIGLRFNIVYTELMRGNCLPSERINAGQTIYVPNVNTATPRVTATQPPLPTNPPPASTLPPPTGTAVPATNTPAPLPTDTPAPPPTNTVLPPTDTLAPLPTDTETPISATP